jgi:hypothetical protein
MDKELGYFSTPMGYEEPVRIWKIGLVEMRSPMKVFMGRP